MKLRVLAAGTAAIGLMLAATAPAIAGPDFQEMRTQLLLQRLLSGEPASAKTGKAAVTRTAKIRVAGTINRKGSFSLPVWCHVYVNYYDGTKSFSEAKSQMAEFEAGIGTCNVVIPFKWSVGDDTSQVSVGADIGNYPLEGGRNKAKAAVEIGRETDVNFPRLPLPAEGSLTLLNFNVDM